MHNFKKLIFLLLILAANQFCIAQNPELALSYFNRGDYEKAIALYKPLYDKNPVQRVYFKNLISSYQQIERFDSAERIIADRMLRFPNQIFLNIEIGYNYDLQGNKNLAHKYYEIAIEYVKEKPNTVFVIGQSFRKNYLLDYALRTYEIAKERDPTLNTEISEAQIYGEKGDLENMFSSYLNLIEKDEKYYPSIQRYIATYITSDKENETNVLFKKLLIKRSQNNPNDSWNILLSWLYVQQQEFGKSLIQEKSLFKRNNSSLDRILEVALISFEYDDLPTCHSAFTFILDYTENHEMKLQAQIYLVQIDLKLAISASEFSKINDRFLELIAYYGKNDLTLDLQIAYADFLAYYYNQPEKAILILNEVIPLARSKFQKGSIQIKLADILVYTNQFNQALILYSSVQSELKNSVLAQEARFKVAQTSYYKGDFNWSKTQLKVLKSSTSQLIANDALELNLLITNNIEEDSLHLALKNYAVSELLAYQNNTDMAIDTLTVLINNFKGHPIEDDALFKQADLYTKSGSYLLAEKNYLKIIEINSTGVLADDSYYMLAELYLEKLDDSERAKKMYEKIIFEFPSSIYLVEARKKYRRLRGEVIP